MTGAPRSSGAWAIRRSSKSRSPRSRATSSWSASASGWGTLQGAYVRTTSGWDLDASCGATQTTLAPLDATRLLLTCSDGRRVVLDTLGRTPPFHFPPAAGDHSFRGLVFEGRPDVLLSDDQGDGGGHLFAARYHGRSFTCAPEGPIHFD